MVEDMNLIVRQTGSCTRGVVVATRSNECFMRPTTYQVYLLVCTGSGRKELCTFPCAAIHFRMERFHLTPSPLADHLQRADVGEPHNVNRGHLALCGPGRCEGALSQHGTAQRSTACSELHRLVAIVSFILFHVWHHNWLDPACIRGCLGDFWERQRHRAAPCVFVFNRLPQSYNARPARQLPASACAAAGPTLHTNSSMHAHPVPRPVLRSAVGPGDSWSDSCHGPLLLDALWEVGLLCRGTGVVPEHAGHAGRRG